MPHRLAAVSGGQSRAADRRAHVEAAAASVGHRPDAGGVRRRRRQGHGQGTRRSGIRRRASGRGGTTCSDCAGADGRRSSGRHSAPRGRRHGSARCRGERLRSPGPGCCWSRSVRSGHGSGGVGQTERRPAAARRRRRRPTARRARFRRSRRRCPKTSGRRVGWSSGSMCLMRPTNSRIPTRRIVGFDVDLMNAITRTLGFVPEYRESAFEAIIPSLRGGRLRRRDVVVHRHQGA